MVVRSHMHGHEVYFDAPSYLWTYTEDDCRVKDDLQRPCKHCGIKTTIEGHDGCLGTLPGVTNACCGHGTETGAYIQFEGGSRKTIRDDEALEYITQTIERRDNDSLHGKAQGNKTMAIKQV